MATTNESILLEIKIDRGQQETQFKKIEKELNSLRDANKELGKSYEQNAEVIAKNNLRIKELQREKSVLQRTINNTNDVLKSETGSVDQQRARLALLYQQYYKMNSIMRETTAEGKSLGAQIKTLSDELNNNKKKVGDYTSNIGRYAEGFKEAAANLAGGNVSVSGIVSGIAGSVPQLALFAPLIENVVGGLEESVKKMRDVKASINGLVGSTGDLLNQQSAQVDAIAETFSKDTDEVIQSANALSKQLGVTFTEALNLVEKGFLAGADSQGEFLDQLKEYPSALRDAGISAEEFVSIITQNQKDGLFSDKGIDLIKEFGIRIREQTKPTRDALDAAFGTQFTDNLFKGLKDRTITTVQALRLVSKELNTTQVNTQELQTLFADVFGGPGEDLNVEYVKSLQGIPATLDSMIDKTNKYTAAQISSLEATKKWDEEVSKFSSNFDGLGTSFSTFFKNAGAEFLSWINFLIEDFGWFYDKVASFFDIIPEKLENTKNFFKGIFTGDIDGAVDAFNKDLSEYDRALKKRRDARDKDRKESASQDAAALAEEQLKRIAAEDKLRADAKKKADDARKKELEEAQKHQRELLELAYRSDKAYYELKKIESEKNSFEELQAITRLLEIERDYRLKAEKLTQNERLLISTETEVKIFNERMKFLASAVDAGKKAAAQYKDELEMIANPVTTKEAQGLTSTEADKLSDSRKVEAAKRDRDLYAMTLEERVSLLINATNTEVETERLREKNINDLRKSGAKYRIDLLKGEVEAAGKLVDGLSTLTGVLASAQSENLGFQKAAALFEIAMNTGKAVAASIANAVEAAGAGGPLAPVLAAVYIATGVAQVYAAMRQANKVINQEPPKPNKTSRAAGGGTFLTNGPTSLLVGDNPGGVEKVTVEPISGTGKTYIDPTSGIVNLPMAERSAAAVASTSSAQFIPNLGPVVDAIGRLNVYARYVDWKAVNDQYINTVNQSNL